MSIPFVGNQSSRYTRKMIVTLAALSALASAPALATDYWVTNGGSDGADGLMQATAWATLGHAANTVNPGDTVHVLDGSYTGFYQSRSGSAGHPIIFKAEGINVQITADNGTTPDGINIEGADYITIDGFNVNNRTRAGIRTALSHFVTVQNCHCSNNGEWGIFSGFADDFTIQFNETDHSQIQHGIYVSNSCVRPIVRGNLVHDNHANGIHMNGDLSEGPPGTITNALIERNVIYGNGVGGGSGINLDGVSNSTIQNNLLYDNHASGISLYQIDAATGAKNNLVVNNTILVAADGRWCVNINSGSTGNTVRNNILYNDHSFHGAISIDASSRPGFASDYNSVISRFSIDQGDSIIDLSAWQGLGYDTHSFIATPAQLFVIPTSDFRLSATSPAIDSGTSTNAPARDLDDNPRPVGAGYDIGAYESQLANCGNNLIDPGEQCGEPGLSCTDQCTSCNQCICAQDPPVCGDGKVCGSEECESNSDCSGGQVCQACACVNPPVCQSGIAITKGRLRIVANAFRLRMSGDVLIPKPWLGVNPLLNGIRIAVDSVNDSGGIDVTIPGGMRVNGVGWAVSKDDKRWTYLDRAGTHGGITRASVRDRSKTQDGLLAFSARGKSTSSVPLPPVTDVRTSVVVGATQECGTFTWPAPGHLRPRCDGNATRIICR